MSGLLSLHEGGIYLLAEILFVIPFLFYPVGGLIADVRIGRYRMIVISGYICLLVCLVAVIGYSLHWYIYDELYVSIIVNFVARTLKALATMLLKFMGRKTQPHIKSCMNIR